MGGQGFGLPFRNSRAMSETDPPEKGKKTAPPTPNTPPAGKSGTVDLTAWKAPPPKEEPAAKGEPKPERAQLPKVSLADLADIRGMLLTDYWEATPKTPSAKTGKIHPYVGLNARLPPTKDHPQGVEVTAITGDDTTAGAQLHTAFMAGKMDGVFTSPPTFPPLKVVNRRSSDPTKDSKPYQMVFIGE